MTRLRRGAVLAIGLLFVASAVGCSTSDSIATHRVPVDQASLSGVSYALYLSPQSAELEDESLPQPKGHVLLVEPSGEYRAVPTSGMNTNSLVWDESGLLFSDTNFDYRIVERGASRWASPKPSAQQSLFNLAGGNPVGVYNHGAVSGGYRNVVVEGTGSDVQARPVEGNYYVTANCDGVVYGVSDVSGKYEQADRGLNGQTPLMLAELTATASGRERLVGIVEEGSDSTSIPDAPCAGGKLHYLGSPRSTELSSGDWPYLQSWDISSGVLVQRPLRWPDGTPVKGPDAASSLQLNSSSLRDGKLEWYGLGNAILATDINTGITRKLFEVEGRTDSDDFSHAIFTPTRIIHLIESSDGAPIRIVEYNRADGVKLQDVTIKGLAQQMDLLNIIRGVAARPQL